jgi:predicted DNA-binding WGR domain protein
VDIFMTNVLHRIDPARNMRRRYELSVQPTLFGDVAVIRHWGRIGGGGQSREDWLASDAEAQAQVSRILEQKRRRGYVEPVAVP